MAEFLIGHTGFVGSNLARQRGFDGYFHRANLDELRGQKVERIVCSAAPAEKWKANKDPRADGENLRRLTDALSTIRCPDAVLISTVDVFPLPVEVDERSSIDADSAHAYGRHRHQLEQFFRDRFNTLVVRLPGLFGPGLKKNIIHDLLRHHETHKIDSRGVFQFYPLHRLWSDIETALEGNVTTIHLATEPVSVREVALEGFGITFDNAPEGSTPARYDVRTMHASLWNRKGPYLMSRGEVLSAIRRFVHDETIRP